jgi:hypothetical protein
MAIVWHVRTDGRTHRSVSRASARSASSSAASRCRASPAASSAASRPPRACASSASSPAAARARARARRVIAILKGRSATHCLWWGGARPGERQGGGRWAAGATIGMLPSGRKVGGGGVRSEAQIRLVPLSVASCPAWVCFIRTTLADASRCSSTRAACSASSCFCSRLTAPCSSLLAPPSSRSCFSAPRRASSDSAAACAYGPAAARTTDGVGPAEYTVQRPGEEEAQTAQAWT